MKAPIKEFLSILLVIGFVTIGQSCKKEASSKLPLIATTPANSITAATALSGGFISSDGGAAVTSNGICWSTTTNPSLSDSKTVEPVGIAQFVSTMNGLSAGTTYNVRAYATNSVGTAYGANLTFTTLGESPSALTQPATNVTAIGATLNGTVNPNYLSTTITFEYGKTESYGSSIDADQSPLSGNSITNIKVNISDLIPGTTYHYRVKTVNSIGTVYSEDLTFTTLGSIPTSMTKAATNISATAATLNGTVYTGYLSTTVTFEYGFTENYGKTYTSTLLTYPDNGVINDVSFQMTDLVPGITYHFRVNAENSLGKTYGSDISFRYTVSDPDGNIYNSVIIGSQVWMKENLKTTRYSDGTSIPLVTDSTAWDELLTPGYCWYNNDPLTFKDSYGALYNFFAVTTDKLCPSGWHVPIEAEWTILSTYLGGVSATGVKLMETGTAHWSGPNIEATNESGFTALPGGARLTSLGFYGLGTTSEWWGGSLGEYAVDIINSSYRLYHVDGGFFGKHFGLSVRCLMDN